MDLRTQQLFEQVQELSVRWLADEKQIGGDDRGGPNRLSLNSGTKLQNGACHVSAGRQNPANQLMARFPRCRVGEGKMKGQGVFLVAALGLVAEFIAQADELVIRFEPPSLPHGSKLIAGYSEGGFIFSTPNGMAHTDVGVSTGGYPSNGTAYLTFGANHRPQIGREHA